MKLSKFEKYFLFPVTHVAVVVLAIGSVYTYLFVYPPRKGLLGLKNPTCCQQLFECEEIRHYEYDCLSCDGRDVYVMVGQGRQKQPQYRNTCERQMEWIIKSREDDKLCCHHPEHGSCLDPTTGMAWDE